MWIVKPFEKLKNEDIKIYNKMYSKYVHHIPLGQTLSWNYPAYKSGASPFLVINESESFFGIFLILNHEIICVNGPLLFSGMSDKSAIAKAVYLVFHEAIRLKKTSDFRRVVLKFRIKEKEYFSFKESCPFPIFQEEEVWTKIVKPKKFETLLKELKSTRRNEVVNVLKENPFTQFINPLNIQALTEFYEIYSQFCQNRGLYLPSYQWFYDLMIVNPYFSNEKISFFLVQGEIKSKRKSYSIVVLQKKRAHLLFSCEKKVNCSSINMSNEDLKSNNYSLNFYLQLKIIDYLESKGVYSYDLNGIVPKELKDHPFQNVSLFKRKLFGEEVKYFCPELHFENE